ncbi:hypothetical protein BU26DRAFT_505864 [Trematosphaeria pertusa]|uniref:Uncharacterized protein n=1 Tax=Trematosphaeria pertusa TaxID=390896 RepID=A0A6A6ID21_9PLEO|nr:uncharacterized protein BU26DRAFT_505864 [Trematosphaeria pertusa]KAF2248109.1 hypothetical protein BU26DRAFT_505864 [Trematosphaeria pertusa]
MKFTTSTLLSTSAILATSAALTPTSGTSYRLVINSTNPAISGSSLALKDDPTANTSPNALGSWSTGEPREEYTFTFSPNPDNDKLYELKGAVRQTHLILTGNDAAMPLYDVAIGADPTPAGDDKLFTNNFMIYNDNELLHAQRWGVTHNASDMVGSGTWRACKNNTEYDYLVLWYDGLSALQDYYEGCETVLLNIEEVGSSGASITGVPAPTATGSGGFITGVPAPTGTNTGFITGVSAPTGNSSGTGARPTPTSFEGAAPQLGMASALISFVFGAAAFML